MKEEQAFAKSFAGTLESVDRLEAENLELRRANRSLETRCHALNETGEYWKSQYERGRRAFLRASLIAAVLCIPAWIGIITVISLLSSLF